MSLLQFSEWLADTQLGTALRESLYMYPVAESSHVLFLCLFTGTLMIVDLRLLGWVFRDVNVSLLCRRILPFMLLGFAAMLVTGALLFLAIPVRTYHSIFFRIKLLLLILAGVNAWLFHRHLRRSPGHWDSDPVPPPRVRRAATISLCCWAFIIVAGRMIAYNWFDCDKQPQSDFINWAAGCVVDLAAQ